MFIGKNIKSNHPGYCSICLGKYPFISAHVRSRTHMYYVRNLPDGWQKMSIEQLHAYFRKLKQPRH